MGWWLAVDAVDCAHWPNHEGFVNTELPAAYPAQTLLDTVHHCARFHDSMVGLAVDDRDEEGDREASLVDGKPVHLLRQRRQAWT